MNAKGEVTPESMYGRRKMTALLRRQDLAVSKRHVDLANKLLGSLWWCLRNGELWDETVAWPSNNVALDSAAA